MIRRMVFEGLALLAVVAGPSCYRGSEAGGDADTDGDTDTDTDADTGSDSETETESGGDVDIDGDADGCDPAYAAACNDLPDAGCLKGDVIVESAEDIAALAGVPCVTGTILVSTAAVSEIALPDVMAACNIMVLDNAVLATLDMEGLEDIHGRLCVGRNATLAALQMPALATARFGIVVWQNDALVDLSGLASLSLSGYISVQENAALTSLDGLQQIATGSAVDIIANPSLASVSGLDGLTTLAQRLWIRENPMLQSLAGLGALESVEAPDVGLGTQVFIGENGALESLSGLSALERVGILSIWGNGALVDVALPSLTEAGDLQIHGNTSLPNVDGLEGLTALGTHVGIFDNAALANLDGLGGVASLEDGGTWVVIENNPELPTCEAQGFVDQIVGFGGETCISGNLADTCPDAVTSGECGDYL